MIIKKNCEKNIYIHKLLSSFVVGVEIFIFSILVFVLSNLK